LKYGVAVAGANPALLQSAAEVRCTVIPTLSAPKQAHRQRIIDNNCIKIQPLCRWHEFSQTELIAAEILRYSIRPSHGLVALIKLGYMERDKRRKTKSPVFWTGLSA
jgi:hypothetical protein